MRNNRVRDCSGILFAPVARHKKIQRKARRAEALSEAGNALSIGISILLISDYYLNPIYVFENLYQYVIFAPR